ncbi:hypothetical protein FQN60_010516 [Etheostoma spectabile]|uniref:Uncharacterized protein n=1 Tax=Etheostoma spectabile TaxID=54343 RepID=A0A5J5DBL1_9PERO|nr:hypothetical protein FQN60_010516 [Etheostoma spectabile]
MENCESHSDMRNIAFMQELCCLLLSGGAPLQQWSYTRQLQDQRGPTRFSHKLLDWLGMHFSWLPKITWKTKQQNPMV